LIERAIVPIRVALATACGNKKREGDWPAHELYLSPRITALYWRKGNFPLYILSARYGLVHSEQVISSYQQVMDYERARELSAQVADVMRPYDWLVFFKAGAREEYASCIRLAATLSSVPVVLIGYAFMGGLQDCLTIVRDLAGGSLPPRNIRSLEVYGAK